MSKEIDELKEEVRAALQGFSEPEIFLLIGIGVRVDSPSQAVRRVSPIVHLNHKEEEVVRKVAKLKKMVRDVDPSTDFSKVLQNLREKESKMTDKKDVIKKVQGLLREHDITLEEVLSPVKTKEEQVVVMEDPVRVASELRDNLRYNFRQEIEPILKKYGWEFWYFDSMIGIDRSGDYSFGMKYELVHKKQTVILSFATNNDDRGESTGGLPERRLSRLPQIKEFAQEVAEKTGYRVEIHK